LLNVLVCDRPSSRQLVMCPLVTTVYPYCNAYLSFNDKPHQPTMQNPLLCC
jgi:hypothetical protein